MRERTVRARATTPRRGPPPGRLDDSGRAEARSYPGRRADKLRRRSRQDSRDRRRAGAVKRRGDSTDPRCTPNDGRGDCRRRGEDVSLSTATSGSVRCRARVVSASRVLDRASGRRQYGPR